MEVSRQEEHKERWQNRSTPLPYLRDLRRSRALTQRELGEHAEVSSSTVRLLECGRRGAYPITLKKLASALDVTPAELTRGHRPEREQHVNE